MKALTYKQYRLMNIILLSVIYVFIESAVTLGANVWFRELPYALSLAVMFTCLEMMRWSGYALPACLVSGITFCLASGASPEQFAIYGLGNVTMLLALIFLKAVGKEKVRNSPLLTIAYVLITFILAQLGRWIVAMFFGAVPVIIVQFVTTDALSALFAIIVLMLMRHVDGMFEDQKTYLIRLEEERRNNAVDIQIDNYEE